MYTYKTSWSAYRGASWNVFKDGVWVKGGDYVMGFQTGNPRRDDLEIARRICREVIADLKMLAR